MKSNLMSSYDIKLCNIKKYICHVGGNLKSSVIKSSRVVVYGKI